MMKYYRDYYWKKGKPYGHEVATTTNGKTYKIVTDAYGKRFSIEQYQEGLFDKTIYDSLLLDFRHLNPVNQMAWQKEVIAENEQTVTCLLRNQDDRAILLETHYFDNKRCRSCKISSIHGLPLSTHRMYYQSLQDPFNGVVLYDLENRPVMVKTYQTDSETDEFTILLSEEWDMQTLPVLLQGVIL
jgi:hypothetical protein